jgi:hypothetical protein
MSAHRAVAWAAALAIGGWLLVIGVWTWWMLQPVTLPALSEPIPILNEGNEIAIGEPIVMELAVDKPGGVRVTQSIRFIQCDSGNLVTLTSAVRDLPSGDYTLIADSVKLPAKVTPGDTCIFTYRNTYQVNPIRTEVTEWSSERFTVLPAAQQ